MRNIDVLPTEERSSSEVDMSRRKMMIALGALAGLAVAGPLACGQDNIVSSRDNCDSSGDSDAMNNGDSPEGCGGDSLSGGDSPEGCAAHPLDEQPCTPEGSSRWSPDGECYCVPEGCCADGPGVSCEDPCFRNENNDCRRPPLWECF